MSPLYNDRFAGHMERGDPRTPMTAAAACTWPTIPPHRYEFRCTNGTGIFSILDVNPLVFQRVTIGPGHDFSQYATWTTPLPYQNCFLFRQMAPDRSHVTWSIELKASPSPGPAIKTVRFDFGPCNVDILVGDFTFGNPLLGNAGSESMLRQVEWDQTEPP